MTAPKYRVQLQIVLAALSEERELTQKEHFELRRLIAGKQNDRAIALLNKIFEREANVLTIMSRLKFLQVEEALKLLNKGKDEP